MTAMQNWVLGNFPKHIFIRHVGKTTSDYYHCMESFCIQSFSGPSFPAFELNKERYSVMRENTDQKNSVCNLQLQQLLLATNTSTTTITHISLSLKCYLIIVYKEITLPRLNVGECWYLAYYNIKSETIFFYTSK